MNRVFRRHAGISVDARQALERFERMPKGVKHDHVWVTGGFDELTLQVPRIVGLVDAIVPAGSVVIIDLPPPVRGAWEAYLAACDSLAEQTNAWQSFWSGLRGSR